MVFYVLYTHDIFSQVQKIFGWDQRKLGKSIILVKKNETEKETCAMAKKIVQKISWSVAAHC